MYPCYFLSEVHLFQQVLNSVHDKGDEWFPATSQLKYRKLSAE